MEPIDFTFIIDGNNYKAIFVIHEKETDVQFHVHEIVPFDFFLKMPYILFLDLKTKVWTWPIDKAKAGLGESIKNGIQFKCNELDLYDLNLYKSK